MVRALGLSAILLAACVAVARAQVVVDQAATAGESYARGMADVVSAAGQANLMNARAAGYWEDARSKELDNRIKYTNTYFQNRELNSQYRAKLEGKPMSSEEAIKLAAANAPKRLKSTQLDPITGQIQWPLALRDPQYQADKQKLETLYDQRAAQGGVLDAQTYREITEACANLRAELDKNVTEYKSWDYLDAMHFLNSLSYEARFPTS